jgi:hypothetical protein
MIDEIMRSRKEYQNQSKPTDGVPQGGQAIRDIFGLYCPYISFTILRTSFHAQFLPCQEKSWTQMVANGLKTIRDSSLRLIWLLCSLFISSSVGFRNNLILQNWNQPWERKKNEGNFWLITWCSGSCERYLGQFLPLSQNDRVCLKMAKFGLEWIKV